MSTIKTPTDLPYGITHFPPNPSNRYSAAAWAVTLPGYTISQTQMFDTEQEALAFYRKANPKLEDYA